MNFFDDITPPLSGEKFETLLENQDVLIEKIISSDKQENKIYEQDHDEWVMIIKGSAKMLMEQEKIHLKEGDFLFIEKGRRHQVLKTSSGTLWLCVHFKKHDK